MAVLLINMLTVEFAFSGVLRDPLKYKEFMEDPAAFFKANDVQFESEEELQELSNLLKAMLTFDKEERITIVEAQKMPYVSKYDTFKKKSDGQFYKQLTRDQVRDIMQQRAAVDATLNAKNDQPVE